MTRSENVPTPYNVGSVLQRLFSTPRDDISIGEDSFNTVGGGEEGGEGKHQNQSSSVHRGKHQYSVGHLLYRMSGRVS